ncbi:AAA family ATPase [Flavobacterium limnophilum]|uniref:AAA family ATPase n=1 Tax=Flavobacterium limnophilum TaxID=3003262 RepID=UPI0024826C24|nr:AAA family ATPase [Flavobacterium limnophilum]
MIIGLFLRHFKIYKGANYIPFGLNQKEMFNLFIGQNGAGKSSILEALNCYFNNSEFIYHTNEKRSESFISPLFIIEKNELLNYDKKVQQIIPIISETLLNLSFTSSTNFKPYESFFEQQLFLNGLKETHYIFTNAYWPQTDNSNQYFITFDNIIKKRIQEIEEFKDEKAYTSIILKLKSDIIKNYSFLYIPVETSIDDFLRLESKGMQDLMSEDVKKRIEKTLNEKLPLKEGRTQKKSILEIINNDLEDFVKEVESTIQEIDKDYDFDKEFKAKTRLTANHLSDVMIETFFSKRKLKKNGKQIKYLSSGERKKALIDIAYSFLIQEQNKERKIILAIDEPESSLHISMCYDQFSRLEELSSKFKIQLLVTSHWYGALPIIDKGNLYHIDSEQEEIKINQYSFRNYFEESGNNPSDIQFKSFFDLASAVISSLRIQETNWLIVESEEDKNYINKHISIQKNLKILPVGGCAIVKLLYNYLYTPISQKSEKKELNGKIFCLIDTDFQGVGTKDFLDDHNNGLLKMRRLQVMETSKIELHKIDTDIKYPTEIEEALDSKIFYEALKETIDESSNLEIKEIFYKFKYDEESVNSFVKGDKSIIYPDTSAIFEGNPSKDKDKIISFIENNKKEICKNYCSKDEIPKPQWIIKIEDFFNK